MTRNELERPRNDEATVGLSGSESEFDLVVTSGGGRLSGDGKPMPEPRLEPNGCVCEQKLMLDLRRLLCLSKVFWAENGLGRIM